MYLAGLIVYLVLLVVVGYISSKRVKTSQDYMIAGRSLNLPILVGTLTATWLGAGTVVGFASIGYENGLGALWWAVGGLAGVGIVFILAKRIRRIAQYTVPDILELRYGSLARVLGAIPVILAYTAIVGYQIKAVGYALEMIMNIDESIGLILGAIIVVLYTVAGGLFAVAYTDVIQYAFLLTSLILATPIALSAAGGFSGWGTSLPTTHFEFTGGMGVVAALGVLLPFFMLTAVDQNIFQRVFAAKDENTAKKGAFFGLLSGAVIMFLILTISMSSRVIFPDIHPDLAVYSIAIELLNPFLGLILLLAILSIIMSTSDGFLLSPATNIVRDIYVRFINPDCKDKKIILLTRMWVVILGVLAFAGAAWFETVLEYAMVAYTIYGAGIFFPLLAAFFWKRATNIGAVASILGGTVFTIVWEFFIDSTLPTIYIGGGASLILLVVISLLTNHSKSEKVDLYPKENESGQIIDQATKATT